MKQMKNLHDRHMLQHGFSWLLLVMSIVNVFNFFLLQDQN